MITRLSIAFEDFLGSLIASKVMPPCFKMSCFSLTQHPLYIQSSIIFSFIQKVNHLSFHRLLYQIRTDCEVVLSSFKINWAIKRLTKTKYHAKYKVSTINRLASISCFLRPFSSACANLDPRSVMRGTRYFLSHKTKTKHLGYLL